MKRKLTLASKLTFLAVMASTMAFGQINTPRPSPAGSVGSTVGLTDVTIEYFRPKVKGRQIFGAGDDFLQPYGQIWRTGANAGTKLTLSTEAKIGGQEVKAGTYLIFTIPDASDWKFMLYSDVSLGGNVAGYKEENEVLRVSAKPEKLSGIVESLTFQISDISEDNTTANIQFSWADVSFKIPISVSFDEVVMKEIAEKTKVNPSNYVQAANYYLTAGKDLDQALEWVTMYLAEGENSKQFWNVHLKARILAKMGKKKEAIETAESSKEMAANFANGDFGYIKRNEDLIAEIKGKKK